MISSEMEDVRRSAQSGRVEGVERDPLFWRLAPLAFVACVVAMILSLPVFPSQDGPMHLYYADVLRGLLTHTGPYAGHFEIKSHLTPYAFEYYSLLLLGSVFPPLLSEKLLICAYVLTFMLGYQYLVRSVTEHPGPWALAGAPFCLNFFVYMGFLNYSFATALVLLLCGCWLRWMKRLTPGRCVIVLGGLTLILLTHPIPAAVFLAFAGLHVAVSVTYEWITGGTLTIEALRNYRRPLALVAVMGIASATWVLPFMNASQVHRALAPEGPAGFFYRAAVELKFWSVTPITGAPYRSALLILTTCVGIAGVVGLWKRRGRIGVAAATVAVMAFVYFLACCTAPDSVNGGGGSFRQRLSIYWVVFLLVFSAGVRPPRWCIGAVGIATLGVTTLVMLFQWNHISGMARDVNVVLKAPLVKPGSLGAIMAEDRPTRSDAAFDPFVWAGAHYFRNSKAILTNAPWMDSEHIMLRPKNPVPWTYFEPEEVPHAILDLPTRTAATALDFSVRLHTEGPATREAIRRLGFQAIYKSPQMTFYSRP